MIPFTRVDWIEPVLMAAAWLVFFIYCWFSLKRKALVKDMRQYLLLYLSLWAFSLFFGRLWSFWGRLEFRAMFFLDFINPYVSGMTSFGMLIGGAFGLVLCIRMMYQNKPFLEELGTFADEIVPAILLWISVFRLGCFLDGHVLGFPTVLPWGLQYPGDSFARHPVALYLALSAIAIFFALKIFLKDVSWHGKRSYWFLFLYCFNRFWIEFLAEGHQWNTDLRYYGMTVVQWICLVLFLSCATVIVMNHYRYPRGKKQHLKTSGV